MLSEQTLASTIAVGHAAAPLPWPLPCGDCASDRAELDALKRTQREQAESMRMLVHELRAPVAASKSMVATLRYVNENDVQLDDFLCRIETRMDQLLDLVNDILDLSLARAGHAREEAVVVDLAAKTGAVCQPYAEEAAGKGLALTVEAAESPLRVRITEQACDLIVSNLVANAVKYTPSGSVSVSLRREGSWAVLQVQDSGIGIPEGEVSRLFSEFFRASNARRGRYPGSGLGLAGVKALVERFGGELEVASVENLGSRFTVRLPLCAENRFQ
jgi:signal transduction histidine kinase